MKFPKIPKNLERLIVGLAVLSVVMNPSRLATTASPEGLLKKAVLGAVIVAAYYLGGVYAAGAVAVFLWFQQTKEGMEVEGKATEDSTCPEGFKFDVGAQMCKGPGGAMVKATQVVCESGYKPNETNDKCIQETPAPAPPPPAVPKPTEPAEPPASSTGSAAAEKAAPAVTTEPFKGGKGTVATTPGEAQAQAQAGTVVLQQQGGAEPFVDWNRAGYPLQ
jgi:hypothetical protein